MNTKQVVALIGAICTTLGPNLKAHVNSPNAYWIGEVLTSIGTALLGAGVMMKHDKEDKPDEK